MRDLAPLALTLTIPVILAAQNSPEFEVASIKRNTTNNYPLTCTLPGGQAVLGSFRSLPTGRITMSTCARAVVGLAYRARGNPQIENLPGWADSDRYDVIVKGPAGASLAQLEPMWRALLLNRMKLRAHYEMREVASYDFIVGRADRRLGPGLRPWQRDAANTNPSPAGQTRTTPDNAMMTCR